MGGLACIFDLEAAPPSQASEDLCAAEAARGAAYTVRGACFSMTAQRRPDEPPPLAESSGLVVAVHGQVFADEAGQTPAERLLEVIRTGSPEELALVDGDFSAVVWNGDRREVTLVRDSFGARPLFYSWAQHRLVVASEIRQVLRARGLLCRLDERQLARYLDGNPERGVRTIYCGVLRAPPGHALTLAPNGRSRVIHLDAPWERRSAAAQGKPPDPEEVTAAIVASVRRRIRGRTLVPLSGGLDSTAVLAAASQLPPGAPRDDRNVVAATFSYPGFECDESEIARRTAARLAVPIVEIDGASGGTYRSARELASLCDLPFVATGYHALLIGKTAEAEGCHAVATGQGGDELFDDASLGLYEAVDRGNPALFVRAAQKFLFPCHMRTWSELAREGVRLLLRRGRQPILPHRSARGESRGAADAGGADWLPLCCSPATSPSRTLSRRRRTLEAVAGGQILEPLEQVLARFGADPVHPFFDRALRDVALSVPQEELSAGRRRKAFLRSAVQAVTDTSDLLEKGSTNFNRVVWRDLARGAGDLPADIGTWRMSALRPVSVEVRRLWKRYGKRLDEVVDSRHRISAQSELATRMALEFWLASRALIAESEDPRDDRS